MLEQQQNICLQDSTGIASQGTRVESGGRRIHPPHYNCQGPICPAENQRTCCPNPAYSSILRSRVANLCDIGARVIGIGGQIAPPPSRPGELHPEPLTGPDVSLSTYPARTTLEGCRLPPRPAGSSCCQLTLIDLHVGRLPPSLHENYPASPLLRSSPLLTCASVLSASRFCRLCLSP